MCIGGEKGKRGEREAFRWAFEFSFVPKPVPHKDGKKPVNWDIKCLHHGWHAPLMFKLN